MGAFNHVLHSANNGGGPGDPKYSKEVNNKINQMADATGLPIDIIMASYEYGLKDASTILTTEGRIMRGINIVGNGSNLLGLSSQIAGIYFEPSSFTVLKTAGTIITQFAKIHPAVRIGLTGAEITGLSDPVYKVSANFINTSIKNMQYTYKMMSYTTLNFNSIYK